MMTNPTSINQQNFVRKTHLYTPENPNIQYSGRIDFANPSAPRFSAPGVTIQARFRGVSAVVLMDDQYRYDVNRNFYDVLIDGQLVLKLGMQKPLTRYSVARGLPDGAHTISVVKRTEANIGCGTFLGFEFEGEILAAPAKPARRIEFIGDSISCGAGNEAVNESPECAEEGWGQPYGNARLAFGPIMAQNLGAAYHLTTVAGIGLVRNYSFAYDPRPMPAVYDLLFVEQLDSPLWEHTRFIPDAVVIALGTNDFSPGDSQRPVLPQDVFVRAYIAFIQKLRAYYPEAHIFCISSSMLNDGWPEATNQFATDQKQSLTKVVDELNHRGDSKIHKFFVSNFAGTGCGTHPSVEQHYDLARELEPFVARVMGW